MTRRATKRAMRRFAADPEFRRAFRADARGALIAAGLGDADAAAVRSGDLESLVGAGMNPRRLARGPGRLAALVTGVVAALTLGTAPAHAIRIGDVAARRVRAANVRANGAIRAGMKHGVRASGRAGVRCAGVPVFLRRALDLGVKSPKQCSFGAITGPKTIVP